MNLIIAGTRTFDNYDLLKKEVSRFIDEINEGDKGIISGCANGADKLGEQYAKEKNIELSLFPADWKTYGKSAGYLRNVQMANHATHCIVFWDGKSKGTELMIKIAVSKNLKTEVIYY